MDKESIYFMQLIDCNCNNCGFMERDMDKRKESMDLHHKWQLEEYEARKARLWESVQKWKEKGDVDIYETLLKEYNRMRFQFDKAEAMIHYAKCSKLNKDISFIPNICQLDTQDCFVHRKDLLP